MSACGDSALFGNRNVCGQLLEYAWDIRMGGTETDFVATGEKKDIVDALVKSYSDKGSRISTHLLDSFKTQTIDWQRDGFYEAMVEKKDSGCWVVQLKHKLLNQTVTRGADITGNDSGFEKWSLLDNFSQTRAKLVTVADSWLCSSFFPRLNRSLKRKNSEEMSIVAVARPRFARAKGLAHAFKEAVGNNPPGADGGNSGAAGSGATGSNTPPGPRLERGAAPPPPEAQDEGDATPGVDGEPLVS